MGFDPYGGVMVYDPYRVCAKEPYGDSNPQSQSHPIPAPHQEESSWWVKAQNILLLEIDISSLVSRLEALFLH